MDEVLDEVQLKDLEARVKILEAAPSYQKYIEGDWLLSKSTMKRAVSIVLHQAVLSVIVSVIWILIVVALSSFH